MEVCEGELINLQGKILSVDGNKITIMPKHEDLKVHKQTITIMHGMLDDMTFLTSFLYTKALCGSDSLRKF